MTTIAYDSHVLAADTQYTEGNHLNGYTRKLHRLPNGAVIAIAGMLGNGYRLMDAIKKKKRPDEVMTKKAINSIDAILVDKDGQGFYLDGAYGDFLPIHDRIMAVGSGSEIAIAAMRSGLTPREAILMVSKVHHGTNDVIDQYQIATQAFLLSSFPD